VGRERAKALITKERGDREFHRRQTKKELPRKREREVLFLTPASLLRERAGE